MISNLKQYTNFSLVFLISNISHLLIYRDHWNDSKIMRKVISELLGTTKLSKLYLGSRPEKNITKYHSEQKDCAFVNIQIHNANLLDYQPKTAEELFAKEMRNQTNMVALNNEWIDVENNVSSINVAIIIADSVQKLESDTQAA